MDSASTSSELISKTGWIADSDIRDVDLDSAAVTAPAHRVSARILFEGTPGRGNSRGVWGVSPQGQKKN